MDSKLGNALYTGSSTLHSPDSKSRSYAVNWTRGGKIDDDMKDGLDDDDNLDSYAHVAGRFHASSSSSGRYQRARNQLVKQFLQFDVPEGNSLPALPKTTGTNLTNPYKQFQKPECNPMDHLIVSGLHSWSAVYKQSANSNHQASSVVSSTHDDDQASEFSFEEFLQTSDLADSWEKKKGKQFGVKPLNVSMNSRASSRNVVWNKPQERALISLDTAGEAPDPSLRPQPLSKFLEVSTFLIILNGFWFVFSLLNLTLSNVICVSLCVCVW